MAVYFSQKISATGTPTALAWSRHRTTRKDPANGSTLVAVAFEDGAVGVYTEEGDPVDPNSGVAVRGERGVVPTALAWHPELPILAVGYADGRLRYWSCRDRRATEDADVHYGRTITVAAWTPDGARLITGDAEGRVGVWAVDERHRPASVCRPRPVPRRRRESHPRRRPTARRRRGDGRIRRRRRRRTNREERHRRRSNGRRGRGRLAVRRRARPDVFLLRRRRRRRRGGPPRGRPRRLRSAHRSRRGIHRGASPRRRR